MLKIKEVKGTHSQSLDVLIGIVQKLGEGQQWLLESQRRADERLNTFKEVSEMHSQSLDVLVGTVQKFGEGQQWLLESQRRTDERLDTFIVAMERYISQGRDGKSQE